MMDWLLDLPNWALIALKAWAVLNVIGIAGIIGFQFGKGANDHEEGTVREV